MSRPNRSDTEGTRFPYYGTTGGGAWTLRLILKRYAQHRAKTGQPERAKLNSSGTYALANLILKIAANTIKGDLACAQIAVEFIEEDAGFFHGLGLKVKVANALRQAPNLTTEQIDRIRRRVVQLITQQEMPYEWRAYSKLAAHVGLGPHFDAIAAATPKNWNGKRAKAYLLLKAQHPVQLASKRRSAHSTRNSPFRSLPKRCHQPAIKRPLTSTRPTAASMEKLFGFIKSLGRSYYIGQPDHCARAGTIRHYELDSLCAEFFNNGIAARDLFRSNSWSREIILLDPLASCLSLSNLIRLIVTLTLGMRKDLIVLFPKLREAGLP